MFYSLLKIQKFFEALYYSLISLLRVILRMRFRSGFRDVKASGKDIFVLANGPSLRRDLDQFGSKIASCNSMGVNMFVLSDDFIRLKPNYYIFLDVVFLKKETLERVSDAREKMLKAFKETLDWDMHLFLPAEGKNSYFHRQLTEAGLPIRFVFFNRTSIYGLKSFSHCMYSRGWGMPPPQNVLIGALMTAIHTGFNRIYILGADHSWHEEISIKEDGSLEINDKHFYNQAGRKLAKHHGETLKRLLVHDFFEELVRTFKSHTLVESYARKKGVEIFNASSVSYIDAYKKIRSSEIPWDQLPDK